MSWEMVFSHFLTCGIEPCALAAVSEVPQIFLPWIHKYKHCNTNFMAVLMQKNTQQIRSLKLCPSITSAISCISSHLKIACKLLTCKKNQALLLPIATDAEMVCKIYLHIIGHQIAVW